VFGSTLRISSGLTQFMLVTGKRGLIQKQLPVSQAHRQVVRARSILQQRPTLHRHGCTSCLQAASLRSVAPAASATLTRQVRANLSSAALQSTPCGTTTPKVTAPDPDTHTSVRPLQSCRAMAPRLLTAHGFIHDMDHPAAWWSIHTTRLRALRHNLTCVRVAADTRGATVSSSVPEPEYVML
jgi:hypothetical protein